MNDSYRILAKGKYMSNDTWTTGLNNNDLIIGPSGAGKTRGYVKPNILQCNESMIIADTKGSLVTEVGHVLKAEGYQVIHMDFKNLHYTHGYNPLDYIRYDRNRRRYCEQDIMTIAHTLVPEIEGDRDPYWNNASRMYLACVIAYVMECLPKREHTCDMSKTCTRKLLRGTSVSSWRSRREMPLKAMLSNCLICSAIMKKRKRRKQALSPFWAKS